jgi:O-acetyl-ADP-ribose deacetylase (regulator of RNase III)
LIRIICGDITQQTTDAIVNSANSHLLARSGVCGAIHRIAGPELEEECRKISNCSTGESRITNAYNLTCRHVIHAVAPRYWDGTRGELELLTSCYRSIFAPTEAYAINSVSIPAIGTGIYRYPLREATEIAFATTIEAQHKHNVVVEFVCFDEDTRSIYEEVYQEWR